jgi:hypothetical protein
LERAGHSRLDHGDARGALELAEQAIALDQFHEASWRLALQAEHALGLRESITKRYDDLTQKSAAGNRRVPILEPLAGELAAHKLRTEGSSDALVFGRTAAEPFNPETIRRNALVA